MSGSSVSFSLSAPGKIILMGEHGVLYDKRGVGVSIDRRTRLRFRERKQADRQLTVDLRELGRVTVWDFKKIYDFINSDKPLKCSLSDFSIDEPDKIDHEQYLALVKEFVDSGRGDGVEWKAEVVSALTGLFYLVGCMLWTSNVDLCPFDVEVESELTVGAGSGSSAAYSVCIAAAIYYYLKLKVLEENRSDPHKSNICNTRFKPHYVHPTNGEDDQSQLTQEDREVINKWAYCVERIMHGRPSGLDNTLCTFGSAVLINTSVSTGSVPARLKPMPDFPSIRILLINTGVSRKTSDLVKRVADVRALIPEAVDSVLTAMDVAAASFIQVLDQVKASEEKRLSSEVTALYKKLESLVDVGQGLLVTLGVSHMRLDEICYITKRRGLHSKLTGAGGGGFAFTIVPPHVDESTVTGVVADLRSSGFNVDNITVGGPGLIIHSHSVSNS